MNDAPKVVVYGNRSCAYCMAARMLLTKKGVDFENINVTNDPDALNEMNERSGLRTVPQIFIGDVHVGGFIELQALNQSGDLDEMLTAR